MMASCPQCGKSLKVRDEYAGRMLKCPGCGSTFKAEAGGGLGGGPRANVKAGAAGVAALSGGKPSTVPVRAHRKPEGGGVAINTNVILLAAGIGAVLLLILATVFGPVRVNRHWAAHHDEADGAVRDVVEYAMKCKASNDGSYNPRKGRSAPSVGDLRMLPDIFTLSIPETVRFDGFGTLGKFEGTYNFETGEVAFDMKLGGLMLPSGVFVSEEGTSVAGGIRDSGGKAAGKAAAAAGKSTASSGTIHVTGRSKSGTISAEIDGKKADIYYPPATDEDGNPL